MIDARGSRLYLRVSFHFERAPIWQVEHVREFPGLSPENLAVSESARLPQTFALELEHHLDIQHASRQLLPPGPTVGAAGIVALFVALITNFDKWQAGDVGTFAIYVLATIVAGALESFCCSGRSGASCVPCIADDW
ncbi:hypothetical protein ACU8NH_31865 (plasmid) [Rhizobium leguminosarum]